MVEWVMVALAVEAVCPQFGDEGGEEDMDMGQEGEMDMGTAAEENGANDMEQGNGGPEPNLADSLFRNMGKKVLNEQSKLRKKMIERSKHYTDVIQRKLLEHTQEKENIAKKVDIYDKAFFLNEEMNDLKTQLETLNENLSSEDE